MTAANTEVRGDPHRAALAALNDAGVQYLVGGAYALQMELGVILREVKDLDLFLRPRDVEAALAALRRAGYETDLTFPHWLAKAWAGDDFIDVIFCSGNGIVTVDDDWFRYARRVELLGMPVLLCPSEEGIWARAFVMERERYDGADVAHLLRCSAAKLDWGRLLQRFGPHWRVLLAHLVLFGFIYPSERDRVPRWVMDHLIGLLAAEHAGTPPDDRVCQGTLLSRAQFLIDVQRWGYADARLRPRGNLTDEEAERWTRAIEEDPGIVRTLLRP
ncbi:MAG TPA: hypothetical protein VIS07_00425 [Candidatus Binatia bacterium]